MDAIRSPDQSELRPNDEIVVSCARVPAVFYHSVATTECIRLSDYPARREPDPDPAQRLGDVPVRRPNDNPIAYRPPDPPQPERPQ